MAGSLLGSGDTPYNGSQFFRWYLLVCAFAGGGNLLATLLAGDPYHCRRVLLESRQRWIKPRQSANLDLHLGAYSRLLGWLPGNETLALALDEKRLRIPRLPPKLVGLTIAHVSDFHLTGKIAASWHRNVLEEVQRLEADFVVITGDILENETCRPWLAEIFGALQGRPRVFFVLGNHDYYIDYQRTIEELEQLGLHYLTGNTQRLAYRGHAVEIAGSERPWIPHEPRFGQEPGQHEHALRILLSHTPDQFQWACSAGADLVLAGHTHGGQIRFPLLGPVAAPSLYGTRFASGVFSRGNTVMHVTRGVSGETPLRWNCPPEIALLTLVSEQPG